LEVVVSLVQENINLADDDGEFMLFCSFMFTSMDL